MRNGLKEHDNFLVYYLKKIEIYPFYEIYLQLHHFNLFELDKELISKRSKNIDHSWFVLIKLCCGIFVAKKNQGYDLRLLNQSLNDVTVFVDDPLRVSLLDA